MLGRRNIVGANPYMAPPSRCRWPPGAKGAAGGSGWEPPSPPMKMSLSSSWGGAAIMNFIHSLSFLEGKPRLGTRISDSTQKLFLETSHLLS